MSVREISYTPQELVHPTVKDGRVLWLSPEVEAILHKLHYGDPVLGWEGDPRLALYMDGEDRWVLERLEADGTYRTVCRSRQGLPLDERLILRLMQHDHQRGFDAASLADERKPSSEEYERTAEALERVAWGIHRDTEGRSQF